MTDQSGEEQMAAYMAEVLPSIDKLLVARDIQLPMRPFQATVEFMLGCVISIRDSGDVERAPGAVTDFVVTDGFARLYALVEQWYRDRFGAAMDKTGDKPIFGVVDIAGTAFAISVPTMRIRPGKPGETVHINIPDGVRPDEAPLSWINAGPNFGSFAKPERKQAEEAATTVASALRYVRTSLLATEQTDAKLTGLTSGILPRLEGAAAMLLRSDAAAVQQACWEMQLACEHGLKALAQQQKGTFRQTHDLYRLYDDTDPAAPFKRDLIKSMPPWKETAEMRYGQATFAHRQQGLALYKVTLDIVAGAVRGLTKHEIGDAEFEIGRPPWLAVALERRKAELSLDAEADPATGSFAQ